MSNGRRDRPARGFLREAAAFGATAGVAQSVAEIVLISWYGVSLRPLDLLLIIAIYTGIGGMAGVGFVVVARILESGRRRRDAKARRVLYFGSIVLAYCVTTGQLVFSRSSGSLAAVSLGLFGIAAISTTALWLRRVDSAPARVMALLALALAGVAASLVPVAWTDVAVPPKRLGLLLGIALPALGAIAALARTHPDSRGRGGAGVAVGALGLAVALWLVFPRIGLDWQVQRHSPVPAAGDVAPARMPFNVLLVVLDTVRAQSLDLFGYERETMPRLREFAEREAHHASPMMANAAATLPAHASMFTGHFVYSHGAHKALLSDGDPPAYAYSLRRELPTLAEWLARAGYRTAGISANFGVLSGYGLARGFEHFDVRRADAGMVRDISWLGAVSVRGLSVAAAVGELLLPGSWSRKTVGFDPWSPEYRRAERIRELAVEWIGEPREAPFFLFLNFLDAHDPFLPPEPYRYRFVAHDPEITWRGFPEHAFLRLMREGEPVPERDADYARGLYDAELAYLDGQLGALLGDLRELGIYDDTLILVVGDHGEGFMEHGIMRHSSTLYDTQVSVPLVVKLPQGAAAPQVAPTFQHVDVLPSILEVVGIEPPLNLQGSAWGRGRGYALSEAYVHYQKHPVLRRELAAVRMGPFKYIRSTHGEEELYDTRSDPGETVNLIGVRPDLAAPMREIADQRERALGGSPLREDEDEGLLERLRALGYVE